MIPFREGGNRRKKQMQRIDGNYLYLVGSQIHPLAAFVAFPTENGTTHGEALYPLITAETALDTLLYRSVFRLKTSRQAGQTLLASIRELKKEAETPNTSAQRFGIMDIINLQSQLTAFENVLGAELGMLPLYVVTQKAGFDTATLIEEGALCFPIEILTKVPLAVKDLEQATKCLAFELPTAAGFHLHRGNESVLHKYWDSVTGGAARPKSSNMGDYLKELKDKDKGDEKVKSALKDLKDLHRNPLIHPEDNLSMSEAIALMNGIYTVMVHMLKEIPDDPVALASYGFGDASKNSQIAVEPGASGGT